MIYFCPYCRSNLIKTDETDSTIIFTCENDYCNFMCEKKKNSYNDNYDLY